MGNLVLVNSIVFVMVGAICILIGLDLRKWYSWLAGLYGFITGCSAGFLAENPSPSWEVGLIFAIIIMASGAVMRQQRLHYSKVAEEWLARYGEDNRFPWLARTIKRLTGK
jgi:hypothetical protein